MLNPRRKNLLSTVFYHWVGIILLISSFSVFADSSASFHAASEDRVAKNRYIVILKDEFMNDVSADVLQANSHDLLELRKQKVERVSKELVEKHKASLNHQYSAAISGFAIGMNESELEDLLKDDRIAYIEEDQIVKANVIQEDAIWGLDRIDQENLPLDNKYNYDYSGKGVTAYVVDSGIYSSHPDFGGRVGKGEDFIDDGFGTEDCDGHGTHVAGTIGSETYGVAKDVALIPVRVLDCEGSGFVSDVVAGLEWILDNSSAPSVINISLSGGSSSTYETAVNALIDQNITIVVSAGNDDDDACNYAPSGVPAVLTIGASTSSDTRASFSNYGDCVDMFAPGQTILSTDLNDGDRYLSGTSMSSPHVAGVVALYLEQNPTAHPYDVEDELKDQAAKDKIIDTLGSPNLLVQTEFSEESTFLSIDNATDYGESDGSYPASNTIDGNLAWESRWEAIGLPANLILDLGSIKHVTDVAISFGKGGDFSYGFEVWARATTSHVWTKVLGQTDTSGTSSSLESYDIADIDAQYIRIKARSNTGNTDVTVIKEVELYGKKAVNKELLIDTAFDDGSSLESYPALNAIDNSIGFESRWSTLSASAVNLTIQLDEVSSVTKMDIAWGLGDESIYEFEVYARPGTSGAWTKVYDNLSSGNTDKLETYDLIDIEAKQVRIKSFGSHLEDEVTNIKEVKIYGL